jgi:hypothetical protein
MVSLQPSLTQPVDGESQDLFADEVVELAGAGSADVTKAGIVCQLFGHICALNNKTQLRINAYFGLINKTEISTNPYSNQCKWGGYQISGGLETSPAQNAQI